MIAGIHTAFCDECETPFTDHDDRRIQTGTAALMKIALVNSYWSVTNAGQVFCVDCKEKNR